MKKYLILIFLFPLMAFSETNSYNSFIKKAVSQKNPHKALQLLKQAKKLDKKNPLAYWISANIYFSKRDFKNSSKNFLKTVLFSKTISKKYFYIQRIKSLSSQFNTTKTNKLYVKAKQLLRQKKYQEAISILFRVQRRNRYNINIYLDLAFAHEQLNQEDYAIFYLKKAEKINPVSAQILGELKTLYIKTKQYNKALSYINFIVKIYPESPFLLYQKAMIFLRQNNISQTKAALKELIKKYPTFSPAYFRLAQIAYLNKNSRNFNQYQQEYLKNINQKEYQNYLKRYFPLKLFQKKLEDWKNRLKVQ